jgi:hypothetical protein
MPGLPNISIRIFLYAHGGLVGESGFLQRAAEYRSALKMRWVRAPDEKRDPGDSKARRHGGFDDDPPTLMSTIEEILPRKEMPKENVFKFERSSSSLSDRRKQLG